MSLSNMDVKVAAERVFETWGAIVGRRMLDEALVAVTNRDKQRWRDITYCFDKLVDQRVNKRSYEEAQTYISGILQSLGFVTSIRRGIGVVVDVKAFVKEDYVGTSVKG